jgi:hypothetical protein
MEHLSQVRGYAYVAGVLRGQTADPFCRSCNSYATILGALKDEIATSESRVSSAPAGQDADASRLLAQTKATVAALQSPASPLKQKQAGNCKLPEGVCLVKHSFAVLQKVQPVQ